MSRLGKPDYGTLYFLYVEKGFTQKALAKNFGVSTATIARWLKFYSIKKKVPSFLQVWYNLTVKKLQEVVEAIKFFLTKEH